MYLVKPIAYHADIELCCEEMAHEKNASMISVSAKIDKSFLPSIPRRNY